MKRSIWWALLAVTLLVAGTLGYRFTATTSNSPKALPDGPSIYELVLKDPDGKPQPMAQWRGRILVVNYWATWCHPCREEMPGFARIQQKLAGNGIQFVGISTDEPSKIAEFIRQTPVNYPLLIGGMETMTDSARFGNSRQALPFTVVFDREGNLVMSKLGRWSEPDLESKLQDLL